MIIKFHGEEEDELLGGGEGGWPSAVARPSSRMDLHQQAEPLPWSNHRRHSLFPPSVAVVVGRSCSIQRLQQQSQNQARVGGARPEGFWLRLMKAASEFKARVEERPRCLLSAAAVRRILI